MTMENKLLYDYDNSTLIYDVGATCYPIQGKIQLLVSQSEDYWKWVDNNQIRFLLSKKTIYETR